MQLAQLPADAPYDLEAVRHSLIQRVPIGSSDQEVEHFLEANGFVKSNLFSMNPAEFEATTTASFSVVNAPLSRSQQDLGLTYYPKSSTLVPYAYYEVVATIDAEPQAFDRSGYFVVLFLLNDQGNVIDIRVQDRYGC